jgi:AAA family ATPase
MDAMLQARVDEEGKVQLTVEQQFLTTSMLPHLTDLYENRRVLFFVATNYGKTFDTAITRPGRFDMLLFVGPPNWRAKRQSLDALVHVRSRDVSPSRKTSDLETATVGPISPMRI